MAGTKAGGKKAAKTNRKKYGSEYYANIGAVGGKNGNTGGFAAKLECDGSCDLGYMFGPHRKAQCAGYKGRVISRKNRGY